MYLNEIQIFIEPLLLLTVEIVVNSMNTEREKEKET